jgi:hypothetical protein
MKKRLYHSYFIKVLICTEVPRNKYFDYCKKIEEIVFGDKFIALAKIFLIMH